MGYPINNYSFFKAVASNDRDKLDNFFRADYSLFGIILHDPINHKDFSDHLEENFHKFNLITGSDFLFTAIADPPESWLNWAKKDGRFKEMVFYENEKINDPELIIQTFDPAYTSAYICEMLRINYHYLPAIIFTNDLRSREYYFLSSSQNDFQNDLTDLNYIAQQLKEGQLFEKLLLSVDQNRLRKVKNPHTRLVSLLLRISTELVKFATNKGELEQQNVFDENWQIKYRHRLTGPVDNKETELKLLSPSAIRKNYSKPKPSDNIEMFSEALKSPLMGFSTFSDPIKGKKAQTTISFADELQKQLNNETSHLESITLIYLQQGIRISKLFNGTEDASPFILPFAKALEVEMSYSLVHWVRKQYDINLPKFFYEYEPNKAAFVSIGRGNKIDFNMETYSQWASPMMGGQISGFRCTVTDSKEHPFHTQLEYEKFLDILYKIKRIRNKATHVNLLKQNDLESIIDLWTQLLKGPFLSVLHELKEKYRSFS